MDCFSFLTCWGVTFKEEGGITFYNIRVNSAGIAGFAMGCGRWLGMARRITAAMEEGPR
jgi:hypothetical protein